MSSRPPHPYLSADGSEIIVDEWWCPVCGAAAHRTLRPGRPKVYCSNACRQRAYRWRRRHAIRLFASPERPAERALTHEKRHALRDRRDVLSRLADNRRRELTVCGAFARPARLGRWTHHRFLPDHPWSCRSCIRLTSADGGGNASGIHHDEIRPPRQDDVAERPRSTTHCRGDRGRYPSFMTSKATQLAHLQQVPLFAGCSRKELQHIARAGDEITMTAGTVVVDQGQHGREAFVVLEGSVTVRRNGRKVTTLGPGAVVGELSLLDHGPRTATAVCDVDCELFVLDQRHFRGVLETQPAIAMKLLATLASRIRDLDRRYYG